MSTQHKKETFTTTKQVMVDGIKEPVAVLDWNELSRQGLLVRINSEIMHPLGLAVFRTPDGNSGGALVSPDSTWHYGDQEPQTATADQVPEPKPNTSTSIQRVDLDGGKYTVVNDNGNLTALRYGEPWRDLCGDNLVAAMMDKINELQAQIDSGPKPLGTDMSHTPVPKLERGDLRKINGQWMVCTDPEIMRFVQVGGPAIVSWRELDSDGKPVTDWIDGDPGTTEPHFGVEIQRAYTGAHLYGLDDFKEMLQDPNVVHVNMCRGIIGKISFDALAHILGDEEVDAWLNKQKQLGRI